MRDTLSRRRLLTLTGSIGLLGATGTASADHGASDAPVPPSAGAYTYATMGTNDSAPVADILGSFKCPYTQDFANNHLPSVIENYVEPGHLRIRFRMLTYEPYPDSPSHDDATYFISNSDPNIARAALGVWEAEPESYWSFFTDLFSNLPSGYVTYDDLRSRMASAGVSASARDEAISFAESGKYEGRIDETTDTFRAYGAQYTPRLTLKGDITNPRWNLDNFLQERLDTSGGSTSDTSTSSSDSDTSTSSSDSDTSTSSSDSGGTSSTSGTSTTSGWKALAVVATDDETEYEFEVSGDLQKGDSIEGAASVSGSTATGVVEWYSDVYKFTGDVEHFDVVSGDPDVDVWVEGTKYGAADFSSNSGSSDSRWSSGSWSDMSIVATGDYTSYEVSVSGDIEAKNQMEGEFDVGGGTASGAVRWYSDNYRFTGDVATFDVVSGDANVDVWIDGSKYSAADF